MLKRINKFSKLAFVFTVLYILFGIFIMSNTFSSIPYYISQIVFYLYLGFIIGSVIMGIIAVMQTNKTQGKGKWIIVLLTLINIIVLVLNIIAIIIYPQTF